MLSNFSFSVCIQLKSINFGWEWEYFGSSNRAENDLTRECKMNMNEYINHPKIHTCMFQHKTDAKHFISRIVAFWIFFPLLGIKMNVKQISCELLNPPKMNDTDLIDLFTHQRWNTHLSRWHRLCVYRLCRKINQYHFHLNSARFS